jgi:hypothetical protein
MKTRHKHWGILVAGIALVSVACLLPPLQSARTQAVSRSHVSSVNHIAKPFVLIDTNRRAADVRND